MWTRLARLVATPLVPSQYLALVAPLARPGRARVEAVIDEVPGVRTLVLRPGRGWQQHRPGHHVRVGVAIDGRIVTRTYSISSAPRDGCFTITVKAQGLVSNALVATPVGTFLTIGVPTGDFVCEAPRASEPRGEQMPLGRALFITAGSGITPIASMLRAFAVRDAWPDVVHVHYTRDERDIIFRDELRALSVACPRYRRIEVSSAARFDQAQLDALVPDWRGRAAWACGPERLLGAVEAVIPGVHVERFAAAFKLAPDAVGGTLRLGTQTFRADGRTPLLRVIEDAGLSPKSGCRMGICHSCDVTLAAGCVRDLRTGVVTDEPGTRIQICVCAAAGDVALELQE
jgi:stearoyl-CoA 9-desaturase NADPH oxidoreductase